MTSPMRWILALVAAAILPAGGSGTTFVLHVLPVPTSGTILYAGPSNVLINVSPAQPNVILSAIGFKGLQPAENIVALAYHPTTSDLFALGSSHRLYRVDPQSGDCTQVGGVITLMTGTAFGMDVNPSANQIRVVGEANENFRLDLFGAPGIADTNLAYAAADINFGTDPVVVACAYNPTQTLYGIDSNLDILVIQNPANSGMLTTVGPLGVNTSMATGLDITAAGLAY